MSRQKQADFILDLNEYVSNLSVDNVIFGYHDKELKVLLQQPIGTNRWTVTGGFIKKTETIEESAHRLAFVRTGLKNLFLQQFRSFGSPGRAKDKEITSKHLNKIAGIKTASDLWLFDYVVSVCFYTLTEFSLVTIQKGQFDQAIQWWPIKQLPVLMFDHKEIIAEALKALQLHMYHYPIGYELLPEKFTLPEIHHLYETIFDKSLDSRNFARRMLGTNIIKKLSETRSIGAHRSPYLYKFDKKNYDAALKNGMFLAF